VCVCVCVFVCPWMPVHARTFPYACTCLHGFLCMHALTHVCVLNIALHACMHAGAMPMVRQQVAQVSLGVWWWSIVRIPSGKQYCQTMAPRQHCIGVWANQALRQLIGSLWCPSLSCSVSYSPAARMLFRWTQGSAHNSQRSRRTEDQLLVIAHGLIKGEGKGGLALCYVLKGLAVVAVACDHYSSRACAAWGGGSLIAPAALR